ncbi:MAG TPA: response regulator [Bryobacteraceae bacterium]|jgi:CheY-like chemotaxis protein|nr:response regulator [Bryobacteraceae bacterium]
MPTEAPTAAAEILLLTQRAEDLEVIRQATETNRLNVVSRCPDILSWLRREGQYGTAVRPDLILLDLDLSNQEDCELLSQVKEDPDFRRIPVVVLAASESQENIYQAYSLHANAYICKPPDRQDFVRVIRATLHFWLALARLPRE